MQPIPAAMRVANSAVSILFFIFKFPPKIFECWRCVLAFGTGYSAITRIRAVYVWGAVAYGFKPFPVYIYQLVIIHSRFRNSFPNFQSDFAGYAPENGRARDLDVPHYQGQMVCRMFDTLYHLITCEMVGCQQAAFEYR